MRGDVRMIQRREDFGFALEARDAVGVSAKTSRRTLMATSRPSRVSRARYTSPIPPAPSPRISYAPSRVPAAMGKRGL